MAFICLGAELQIEQHVRYIFTEYNMCLRHVSFGMLATRILSNSSAVPKRFWKLYSDNSSWNATSVDAEIRPLAARKWWMMPKLYGICH